MVLKNVLKRQTKVYLANKVTTCINQYTPVAEFGTINNRHVF